MATSSSIGILPCATCGSPEAAAAMATRWARRSERCSPGRSDDATPDPFFGWLVDSTPSFRLLAEASVSR